MEEKRKYAFACPHCKREIRYDRDYYDRQIAQLHDELQRIRVNLAEINEAQKQNRNYMSIRKMSLIREEEHKNKQLQQLKAFRKGANIRIGELKEQNFRRLVKERLGVKEYEALRVQAEEELKDDYQTSDLMQVGYTRKGGKNIAKIG